MEKKDIFKKFNNREIQKELEGLNIKSVILFGSLVYGDFTVESDIDIAVIGEDILKLKDILKLESFFEDELDREIDLVDLKNENLDIFLKVKILNDGEKVYTSDNNNEFNKYYDKIDNYYNVNKSFFEIRKRDLFSE
ncbi:MAG: type VII toxin-antitoxin system MntA family adenylyltransferase antitoxin [Clostridium sp.]|uniref:type VII toxin-antitoxin system MntA family adenylyltransferase antitoxin n=1 Tax=Clostridium sp. TaxID=1506 RepID=UPI003F3B3301